MATFKRLKLFTNVTQYDMNNLMIEEVWAYKFEKGTEEKSTKAGRYRIRYQKTDQSFMFTDSELSEADMAAFAEAMNTHGPAISAEVSHWHNEKGWIKCLDWMGEPVTSHDQVCEELNNQFRSFITGTPLEKVFYSIPTPKRAPNKETSDVKVPQPEVTTDKNTGKETDESDFEWI